MSAALGSNWWFVNEIGRIRALRVAPVLRFTIAAVIFSAAIGMNAQSDLPVYIDGLVSGFQDWGWAPHNYANTSPVHSGKNSVSVSIASAWQGLQIVHSAFDSTPYVSVSFWINGGASGGQQLQISGLAQISGTQNVWQTAFSLGTLPASSWQQFTIPLSALGLANKSNATGIVIQDRIGATQPTFYLDDIQLE